MVLSGQRPLDWGDSTNAVIAAEVFVAKYSFQTSRFLIFCVPPAPPQESADSFYRGQSRWASSTGTERPEFAGHVESKRFGRDSGFGLIFVLGGGRVANRKTIAVMMR